MKHLISVTALLLSIPACSIDSTGDGVGGSSSTGGSSSAGGSSGSGGVPGTGGTIATTTGGTGMATGGTVATTTGGTVAATTGGSTASGGSAATTGGTGTGGSATGGSATTGGSGPTASFKCDNLALAPTATGVAKPAGAAGGMKVLDWAGFKGAASFTFDDNTPSQLANYNALKATGGRFTWFLIAGSAGDGYKATIADGQEIANHTQTHGSPSQGDVTTAQTTLKTKYGADAHTMAAPNCAAGWASMAAPAKLFQNRGPCGGVPAVSPRDSTDRFLLPAYLPPQGADAANLSGQLAMGKWRIYVIHGFDSQGGTYQPVPIASVTGAMTKAVTDGLWVEGMTNVGAYWQGQKLIPDSAAASATWTLPADFPPNMCLRVTTTGGTVKQKGETIAWDPHGYYQISLDAGAVTVE